MPKKEFSTEQLTDRWEHYQEIVNLMGKRSFYTLWRMDDTIFNELWCKKAPDPSMGFNDGYYKGYEAIAGFYKATHDLAALKSRVVQDLYPEKLGKKSLEEIHGVGSLVAENLTTPLVEVAEDGKTAKGLWYYMMTDTDVSAAGPGTHHQWGWLGVDFVYEDGAWKIWHMITTHEFRIIAGKSWADEYVQKPVKPEFAAIAGFVFPQPNLPMTVYETYDFKRPIKPFPAPPKPYDTFKNTFSYGI